MGTGRIILQAASLFVIFTALGFIAAALLRDAI